VAWFALNGIIIAYEIVARGYYQTQDKEVKLSMQMPISGIVLSINFMLFVSLKGER
jgi:hypothetical protein